jgi:hypothetical protein
MPIIDADKAKTVLAIKRAMNPASRDRERALLRRQHPDAVRRCEGRHREVVKEFAGKQSIH